VDITAAKRPKPDAGRRQRRFDTGGSDTVSILQRQFDRGKSGAFRDVSIAGVTTVSLDGTKVRKRFRSTPAARSRFTGDSITAAITGVDATVELSALARKLAGQLQ